MSDKEVELLREFAKDHAKAMEFIGECGLTPLFVMMDAGCDWVEEAEAIRHFITAREAAKDDKPTGS